MKPYSHFKLKMADYFNGMIVLFFALGGTAPPLQADFVSPPEIEHRVAEVWSEGVRLKAEVFLSREMIGAKLPTIIMSHGWGGVAAHLRPDAVYFAKAGFMVVTFDYRGWGASDGRLVASHDLPSGRSNAPFNLSVKEIREVVDPIEQTTDLLNVIHWVQSEPSCDTERLGLWGSSFSGGHVIYAAARDPRVKATVSQVPSMDGRWAFAPGEMRQQTQRQATARARGELGYPEPGSKVIGNLKGAPILEKMMRYAPVEDIRRTEHCAKLIVLAENEELFDNRDHGVLAYERAPGIKKLITLPRIKHYGIYNEARSKAQSLALDWFQEHLK